MVLLFIFLLLSGRSRNLSEDLTTPTLVAGHDSPDAFPLEYGGKLKTKFGIRTSRSYDLLTDAVKDTGRDQTDGGHLSSSSHGYPLGLSPRLGCLLDCVVRVLYGSLCM